MEYSLDFKIPIALHFDYARCKYVLDEPVTLKFSFIRKKDIVRNLSGYWRVAPSTKDKIVETLHLNPGDIFDDIHVETYDTMINYKQTGNLEYKVHHRWYILLESYKYNRHLAYILQDS